MRLELSYGGVDAVLTTEQAASSYGVPVLCVHGEALGSADLLDVGGQTVTARQYVERALDGMDLTELSPEEGHGLATWGFACDAPALRFACCDCACPLRGPDEVRGHWAFYRKHHDLFVEIATGTRYRVTEDGMEEVCSE